ncbi:MAG TPA: class I SAM-dependent methyltransferase, partial [Stellaceae bacterium]|nr:class I SAM-dependent methyltransferase [Stellaceae bacterium]
STIPDDWPADGLQLVIADEGAVAALIKGPSVTTLANLWAAGRVDLRNGTIFDLVARRPRGRTRELRKSLASLSTLGALAPFLFVPRGGPWPLEGVKPDRESGGTEGENARNIAYHYDLSNAFYALWLDKDMVYTCAYFHDWGDDLDTAQRQKLDMTCRKLRLEPGETLLDIGSGWGSLACHAAERYGVHVLGVTLSDEQIALSREKAERRGLADRVTFEKRDYALLEGDGRFDKIVSVGMFEHVGLANFESYFGTVQRLLKPGGLYLHHAITRPGGSHAARTGKKRPEFQALTRYIFPGGELDYLGRTITNLERAGFEVRDIECWREHYRLTTRLWHDRLRARWDEAVAAVGETTARVWLAYLAACSITFERNNAGVYQTLAMKRLRGPSGLPPTRADLYR